VASSKAGWVNAVLIPVKQHLVCCGLLPLAASSSGTAGAWLDSAPGQWAAGLIVPPLMTGAVMLGEQLWHNASRPGCECKTLTSRNFFRQTALAYAFYAAASLVMPKHDHAHQPHTIDGKPVRTFGLHQ